MVKAGLDKQTFFFFFMLLIIFGFPGGFPNIGKAIQISFKKKVGIKIAHGQTW